MSIEKSQQHQKSDDTAWHSFSMSKMDNSVIRNDLGWYLSSFLTNALSSDGSCLKSKTHSWKSLLAGLWLHGICNGYLQNLSVFSNNGRKPGNRGTASHVPGPLHLHSWFSGKSSPKISAENFCFHYPTLKVCGPRMPMQKHIQTPYSPLGIVWKLDTRIGHQGWQWRIPWP